MIRSAGLMVGLVALVFAGAGQANTIFIVDVNGAPQVSPPPTGQGSQFFVTAVDCAGEECIQGLLGAPALFDNNRSTAHTGVPNPAAGELAFLKDTLLVTVTEQYATSFSKDSLSDGVFSTNREYFAVKQGGPGGGWTAFFKNVSGGYVTLDIQRDFSHVTEIGAVVPIPPAFLLFGSALLGMGWLARRQRVRRESMGEGQAA